MMKTEMITLAGDVPGNSIELRVLRFEGEEQRGHQRLFAIVVAWFGTAGPGRVAFSHSDAREG